MARNSYGGTGNNFCDGASSCAYQDKVASDWGGERGVYLVWEDLTVVLPNFGNGPTKRLLQGLRGYAEPGRITAIMGPSGSGKSTLLDSLAGMFFFFLKSVLAAPPKLKFLSNLYFGSLSFEIIWFGIKLHFIHGLVLEFKGRSEKKVGCTSVTINERNFIKMVLAS